ncbi:hypothetical protein ABMA70_15220 [Halobacteriovorax sp. XZX-3]|uniref:hypothetical protein n=1 Tax=unclassified Halobacteriovorax TaxID=2639665 RepID=UPI003719C227
MKKQLMSLILTTLLCFNSYALFGAKDDGISGEYKGSQRVALTYTGINLYSRCSNYKHHEFWFYHLLGTGVGAVIVGTGTLAVPFIAIPILAIEGARVANCAGNVTNTRSIKAKFEAKIFETNTQRITLALKSEGKKKCAGISMKVIGESDGFGGYRLYKDQEAYLNNVELGNVLYSGKEIELSIARGIKLYSKGRNGDTCTWNFEHGLGLTLKK